MFTRMLVGAVPAVIVIWLLGLPALSVLGHGALAHAAVAKPVRFTLPTTSVAPLEVAVLGIVKVEVLVMRSPLVSVSAALTMASPVSVTPEELLIVNPPYVIPCAF